MRAGRPGVAVMLTDAEERSVLAASRGLHQAGYRVFAVASKRPAPTHWSRSCHRRFLLADPRIDPTSYTAGLEEILRREDCEVLVPGTDTSMLAISEHRQRFEPLVRLGLPSRRVVRRAMDRAFIYREAASLGFSVPTSITCAGVAGARAAAREIGYPVIVKPAREVGRKGRSLVAADEVALASAMRRLTGPYIVQRLEFGCHVLSCGGVMAGDRVHSIAVSRYLRTWPANAGSASLAETIAPPPGLADAIEALLIAIGWQGIFEVELLAWDDGRLSLIDFNPRLYGSLSLAVAAGANLPAIWCDHLLGGTPVPVVAEAGFRYRWEDGELSNLVSLACRGRFGEAAAVLAPLRNVTHAQFRLSDPGPLAARLVHLARRALGGLPARLRPVTPPRHV
jgi:predicted ATP-grasp superfamily ATP-dependent carboligase